MCESYGQLSVNFICSNFSEDFANHMSHWLFSNGECKDLNQFKGEHFGMT